jgi:predicted transcriptional regulator
MKKTIHLSNTMKYTLSLLKQQPMRPKDLQSALGFSNTSQQASIILNKLKRAGLVTANVNELCKRERYYHLK